MKYFTSNIILYIEMSIINLKIIFVKKQKRTRKRPTQARPGRDIHYNRNGRVTLEKGYSCETGYPFDDSRQIGNTS